VFHSYFGDASLVRDVHVSERPEGEVASAQTRLAEDIFLFAANGQRLSYGEMESDAEIVVIQKQGDGTHSITMFAGTRVQSGANSLASGQAYFKGNVKEAVNRKDEAFFVLEGDCPAQGDWKGHTLIVTGEDGVGRPYQIVKTAWMEGAFRAYTRVDGMGLPVREAKNWLLPNKAFAEF
jgi:ribulose-5-phosphate 4-epimerase/fuculose-1-phosphate aldolase